MPEEIEQLVDSLLESVKAQAGRSWHEGDTDFVRGCLTEIAKLSIKIKSADHEERKGLRQEIRVERAAMLMRISRRVLRAGGALRTILTNAVGFLFNLLAARLNIGVAP